MPYLPTVNAIAPNTPSGANLTTKFIILKTMSLTRPMKSVTGLARSPHKETAQPNMIETISTCRMSPVVKAPTTVEGMSFIRNSETPPPATWAAV
jgi:hypothetical protein